MEKLITNLNDEIKEQELKFREELNEKKKEIDLKEV